MKRILSAILAVTMLTVPLTACNTNETTAETTATEPTVNPEDLPSAIDLRDYNGKNYVTPVKRQLFGDCWSFGNIAAAEISYLYANDLGVPAGEVNNNVDFSEKYNVWYAYHSITEDDVTLGKVRASQVGEGFDTTVAESEYPDSVYFLGGAIYASANLFASGFTPVEESVTVNGEKPYFYSGKYSEFIEDEVQYDPEDDWSLPLNAQYRNPVSKAYFRNSYLLPSPASFDENGEYIYNEEAVTAIKTEIYKGHGVAIAALFEGMMNPENCAVYNRDGEANHVITIVGYDDNYPKENFSMTNIDGEFIEGSIPPTDGAFLIKNSEGVCGIEGSGYYYMSYYDHTISYPTSFSFDKSDTVKCTSPNYDQYDMLLIGWSGHADYDSETKIANVFDAEEDEYLYQIAYKTNMPNTSVHYEIYKNIEADTPNSGTLLEEGDSSHQWAGYHRLDLKGEYELKKGEKYSVVLTLTYKADDGTTKYTEVIPYASSMQGVTAIGVINKGESYIFTNNKWNDISNMKDTLAQYAYEDNLKANLPDVFKAQSAEDIAVDNYPIKAILIPKSEHK